MPDSVRKDLAPVTLTRATAERVMQRMDLAQLQWDARFGDKAMGGRLINNDATTQCVALKRIIARSRHTPDWEPVRIRGGSWSKIGPDGAPTSPSRAASDTLCVPPATTVSFAVQIDTATLYPGNGLFMLARNAPDQGPASLDIQNEWLELIIPVAADDRVRYFGIRIVPVRATLIGVSF